MTNAVFVPGIGLGVVASGGGGGRDELRLTAPDPVSDSSPQDPHRTKENGGAAVRRLGDGSIALEFVNDRAVVEALLGSVDKAELLGPQLQDLLSDAAQDTPTGVLSGAPADLRRLLSTAISRHVRKYGSMKGPDSGGDAELVTKMMALLEQARVGAATWRPENKAAGGAGAAGSASDMNVSRRGWR